MLRAPSLRRFAAAALASIVAVFSVLALRVHAGQDPALGAVSAKTPSSTSTSSTSGSSGASSSDTGSSSSGTGSGSSSSSSSSDDSSSWSSGAPTTRAS